MNARATVLPGARRGASGAGIRAAWASGVGRLLLPTLLVLSWVLSGCASPTPSAPPGLGASEARRAIVAALPEKTAETIDAEGWLHTGDVGAVDEEGFFRITDRMKDIIITAGGKNITPSEFENELKFSPYITDAVVIGDRRPYLTVIIMIDQENVEKFAQDNDVPFSNYASLTR